MEICGLSSNKNEDLKKLVMLLGEKVGSTIKEQNIIAVYRKHNVNENINGGTHPIVAVINDRKVKTDFIKHYRKKDKLNSKILENPNLENRPLYVNHELTKTSQFLLAKAKELRNQNLIKYVWVGEGSILIRKVDGGPTIKIHSLLHLNNVIAKKQQRN